MKGKLGWLIAGAIVLILLGVVGGPYVYIHFVEAKAPAPLSVDTTTSGSRSAAATTADPAPASSSAAATDTATDSSSSIDGTWKVGTGSLVGYRVKEVLFGQSNEAYGRTSSVSGSITVSGHSLTAGSFSADLRTVSSDQSRRDAQFQGRIMNTATYPTAEFTITKAVDLGSEPADGVTVTKQVTGDLKLHGVTKTITLDVKIKKAGSTIPVSGSTTIVFADYNIPNPSFGGTVTTDDHGTLEFLLNFSKS